MQIVQLPHGIFTDIVINPRHVREGEGREMKERKPFERLNVNPRRPVDTIVHGRLVNPYWMDRSLEARYRDCPQFLDRVEQKFEHVQTLRVWHDPRAETDAKNFKTWIDGELQHPELKKCWDNTPRKKIETLKNSLKRGII